jgi:putative DNA methylase
MTDAEQLLWQCLRRKQLGGYRFRKQHPLERFVLDFYCPAVRLAVELDGSQHNTPDGLAKDEERTAILQQHGIEVIRFWNNEVLTNLEGVLQSIYEALQRRELPPPQPSPAGEGSHASPPASGATTSPPAGGTEGGEEEELSLCEGGSGAKAYAEAVSVYLAMITSKATVANNTLARWRPDASKTAPAFGRQAIAMVWDFAETNPFAGAGGDFLGIADGTGKLLEKLLSQSRPGFVSQSDAATKLTAPINTVISTDPPYYDNIGYADLSDFSYVWLRPMLKTIYPEILATLLVPKEAELIATSYRFNGDKEAANNHFESGLLRAFANMCQITPPDYPLTVYYAFKQQEIAVEEGTASTGWETMLSGLIETGFSVTGTWPIRTEGASRLVASGTNALASSIVLVCRPRPDNAPVTSRRDFVNALRRELPEALQQMQSGSIAPVDLAQASIGPGMAVYSRYSQVLEPDGSRLSVRTALQLINHELDAYLAEQEGILDAGSRFAVAWFEQFGFKAAGFGQADVLARAKNTSVEGLVNAGLLESGGGKVRLLHWSELDPGWEPAGDSRLTVWEATHHLIQELDTRGETGAAQLLAKLSPDLAAEARQLAYRLYSICERKGWTDPARDYNALVISWNASQEQAAAFKARSYEQGRMFE